MNKRASVSDARLNLKGPKKMISLKRTAPNIKQRITAPGQNSGNNQTGNDARKKINTIRLQNRNTVSLRTNKVFDNIYYNFNQLSSISNRLK